MSGSVTIDLPHNMTIAAAEALHELLEPYANGSDDIAINAAKVERVDTAGLQTLLAFKLALQGRNVPVTWVSPSQQFSEAAQQLGLFDVMSISD